MIIVLAIGKTFLILLFVLICIVAVALFWPISYELDLEMERKQVDIRVNWLFRLVRFRFYIKEQMEAVLSVLFFRYDFLDPETKKKRAVRRGKKAERKRKKRLNQEKKREKLREKQRREYEKRKTCKEDTLNRSFSVNEEEKIETIMLSAEEPSPEKNEEADGQKYQNGSEKQSGNTGWKRTLERSVDAVGAIFGYVNVFRRILGLVRKYEVISTVWPKLYKFLKKIRPRKIQGRVAFGLDDPSATGKLTGYIAMIPLFYETELCISPDFETDFTYVRGNVSIKGNLLLIHVLILIIALIREKKIRWFIGAVKKGK